jgi:hypothetical protein
MTLFAQELTAHTGRLRGHTGADRESLQSTRSTPEPLAAAQPDSFQTWRSIRFRDPLLLIVIPLTALAFYALSLSVTAISSRLGPVATHAIGLGIPALWALFLLSNYLRFRHWKARLPFAVAGWDEVVNHTAFETGVWRHAEVKLILSPNISPEQEKHFAAGIIVFAHLANSSYGERFAGDPRRYWNTDIVKASGSIDINVAALFIGLCTKKLNHAAQRYPGCLQRVEITLSGDPFIADPDDAAQP